MKSKFQQLAGTLILATLLGISNFTFSQTDKEKMQYEEAMKSLALLNRIKANEILTKIITTNPDYSAAQYQAGLIDLHFNRNDEAIQHFNKVIELNGEEVGLAYVELSKISLKQGNQTQSLELLNSVIEKDNGNHYALAERGKIKLTNKDYLGAKEDLTSAILYNSTAYTYFYYRGVALIELKDYPNAIQDFDKVIANIVEKSILENAYFYRGFSFFQESTDPKYKGHKGLLQKALHDYDKCISMDRKDEVAFYNRGEVNMLLGHYVNAISDFKHAILLNPKNYDAHYNKAMCNYHFGEVKSAIRELDELIKINPEYTDAYFQLGMFQYEQGKFTTSIATFDKLIALEDAHSDAYLFRGYANLDAGYIDLACEDWKMADKLGDKEAHKDLNKYCQKKETTEVEKTK